jgi:hypothetical protein
MSDDVRDHSGHSVAASDMQPDGLHDLGVALLNSMEKPSPLNMPHDGSEKSADGTTCRIARMRSRRRRSDLAGSHQEYHRHCSHPQEDLE